MPAVLIAALELPYAANAVTMLDLSTTPITGQSAAKPNIIFAVDDSGSMDFEVLLPTNDGAGWWEKTTKAFTDASGAPLFNSNGVAGVVGGQTWYKYAYLFPNGYLNSSTGEVRKYSDGTYSHFAVPPIPAFAFFRDYQYNPLYYNPFQTYSPWGPAYIGGATRTFANANSTARSHPYYPSPTIGSTINLIATLSSTSSDWTFQMLPGMVIPGASISGITASKNGGSFQSITTNVTIASSDTYDVNVPYYPATYWIRDPSCTSGSSCALAPDNKWLRRYEIKSGNTFPSGRTYAAELQNFANWFQYYRKRKLMLASAMSQVLPRIHGLRAGSTYFNANAGSNVTMYDFDATTDSTNYKVVLGAIYSNQSANGTPTRDSLNAVGQQFMRTDAGAPIQFACQSNAAMVLTDGFANASSSMNLPSYDRTKWGNGAPYTTIYKNSLADIALYYYGGANNGSLRTDLDNPSTPGLVPVNPTNTSPAADKNPHLHMTTYALTLSAPGTIYGTSSLSYTRSPYSYPPTWPNPTTDYSPTAVDDLWHATIDGRGLMYSASDVVDTTNQIQAMVADLLNKSGSAAAVAVSNVNIRAGDNTAYASIYGTGGWYGDLLAYPVDTVSGNVTTNTPQWSAQTQLESKDPASRIIATYNPATQTAVPFEWASLNGTMQSQLSTIASAPTLTNGQETLNFLRGSRAPQEADGYRVRTFILGDIVDSEPVSVRGAVGNYPDPGYSVFSGTVANRQAVVYQGANDGMMHAFEAATGNELWAYIPSLVFANLSELASPNYTHRFYVDGTPSVGDVDFGNGSGDWHTILVGGLRLGGAGYYALDITTPTAGNEAGAASKVLWEFPNPTTPSAYSQNVGYSFGKPVIVKTAAFGWVVVVTSGYNNGAGDFRGHVFFLNPRTGQVLKDLVTPSGFGSSTNPVNLGQVSGFLPNPQQGPIVDSLYGGDNLGNVWRFDVSDASASNWAVYRLATLTDTAGNPQPITSAPELTTITSVTPNKRVVVIGTGRLLGNSDITNNNIQSMYALADDRSGAPTITNPRTQLTHKILTVGAGGIRNVNSDAVDWSNSKGWYFDFPSGERVTGDPVVAYGSLVFTTNLPSPVACSSGSYLYAVNVVTGGQLPASNFASGETAWTGKYVASSLATRPVVVVLPSGQINSLIRAGDGSIVSDRLPLAWNRQVRKAGWKEIVR